MTKVQSDIFACNFSFHTLVDFIKEVCICWWLRLTDATDLFSVANFEQKRTIKNLNSTDDIPCPNFKDESIRSKFQQNPPQFTVDVVKQITASKTFANLQKITEQRADKNKAAEKNRIKCQKKR